MEKKRSFFFYCFLDLDDATQNDAKGLRVSRIDDRVVRVSNDCHFAFDWCAVPPTCYFVLLCQERFHTGHPVHPGLLARVVSS